MSERKKKALKIVVAPRVGAILEAPPALIASTHTVDYTCGYCGGVLIHAEEGQVHGLIIRCTSLRLIQRNRMTARASANMHINPNPQDACQMGRKLWAKYTAERQRSRSKGC